MLWFWACAAPVPVVMTNAVIAALNNSNTNIRFIRFMTIASFLLVLTLPILVSGVAEDH